MTRATPKPCPPPVARRRSSNAIVWSALVAVLAAAGCKRPLTRVTVRAPAVDLSQLCARGPVDAPSGRDGRRLRVQHHEELPASWEPLGLSYVLDGRCIAELDAPSLSTRIARVVFDGYAPTGPHELVVIAAFRWQGTHTVRVRSKLQLDLTRDEIVRVFILPASEPGPTVRIRFAEHSSWPQGVGGPTSGARQLR